MCTTLAICSTTELGWRGRREGEGKNPIASACNEILFAKQQSSLARVKATGVTGGASARTIYCVLRAESGKLQVLYGYNIKRRVSRKGGETSRRGVSVGELSFGRVNGEYVNLLKR